MGKMTEKAYLLGNFVGGYIPRQKALHLRLIALYQDESIQTLLEKMADHYIQAGEPKEAMISAIADRAFMEWLRLRKTISKGDYANQWVIFLKAFTDQLDKKKLDEEVTRSIIQEFKAKGK